MANNQKKMKNKLKEVKSNPLKLFGIVYPYIFILGLALGFLYINNMDNISRQKIPPKLQDTAAVSDLPVVEPRTVPPINIMELSQPNQQLVDEGSKIFAATCVSCHGADGMGNGPAAASLNPAPRNFTNKDGWVNGPKLSSIFTTLTEGIAGSGMIAYDYLTPKERISLAHYIRSTFVPNPPLDTKDELTALDQTYNLSQGKEIAAQIPVAEATKLVLNETDQKVKKLNEVFNKILADKSSNGVKLFNKVTTDKMKALTLISNTNNWQQNEDAFINSIASDASQNGFNGEVFKLNNKEWDELYRYVSSYF